MVAFGQHRGDLDGHRAMMGVMYGGGETPLSAVRPCRMGVTSKKTLDMYGSPHLIMIQQLFLPFFFHNKCQTIYTSYDAQ